jgi:hypothetical protein
MRRSSSLEFPADAENVRTGQGLIRTSGQRILCLDDDGGCRAHRSNPGDGARPTNHYSASTLRTRLRPISNLALRTFGGDVVPHVLIDAQIRDIQESGRISGHDLEQWPDRAPDDAPGRAQLACQASHGGVLAA